MNTNILDYGAKPDAKTLCTKEIQAAIDACAKSVGGIVTVPAGNYLIGTIWLRSNVNLHLEHGSVLRGSDDLDDYNDEDAYEQNMSSRANEKWLGKHLVIALECENVAVTGTGTLDGNGDFFMAPPKPWHAYVWNEGCRQARDEEMCRPGQLLCFIQCKRVTVQDITITNQPCWGCFLHGCEFVNIRGMKTFNEHTIFNSDGIDIDCCRYVTISDCLIDTGDDCIAIRGNDRKLKNRPQTCEYITITNCVLGSSSCAFRLGVGCSAIRHVRVSNICITRGAPGICIMSSYHGKGNVSIEDVIFSNISMTRCSRPFEITEDSQEKVSIKDILIENVQAEVYGYIDFHIENIGTVENLKFRNWKIQMIDGLKPFSPRCHALKGETWFRAKNVKGLVVDEFAVCDEEGYLDAWPNGFISVENCPDSKWTGITLNGKEVTVK